jgi:hypothetical protein
MLAIPCGQPAFVDEVFDDDRFRRQRYPNHTTIRSISRRWQSLDITGSNPIWRRASGPDAAASVESFDDFDLSAPPRARVAATRGGQAVVPRLEF